MSLSTFSSFYYDYQVTGSNFYIDFNEGAGELTAQVDVGSYSLTDFLIEVGEAMTAAGTQTYDVSVARATRLVTISATSNFDLLISSGSSVGNDLYSALGFTGADQTGTNSYTGSAACGSEYLPQFILQDHISSDDWQRNVDATVRKSANGTIEVVRFGIEKFVQLNIKYATDKAGDESLILSNATGVADLRTFMQYLITKKPIEFMPDRDSPATFETLILESTQQDSNGLQYRLREMYDRGLPGYFETGPLKFRVVE